MRRRLSSRAVSICRGYPGHRAENAQGGLRVVAADLEDGFARKDDEFRILHDANVGRAAQSAEERNLAECIAAAVKPADDLDLP